LSSANHSGNPALLFDLDGTLVDSVYQHVLAWHETLEAAGIALSVWRIHRRIGMSGGLFIRALEREIGRAIAGDEGRPSCGGCPRCDLCRAPPSFCAR
jgi:phosphoglycolate phosphatase-like HAD superfamily hydrolase